VALALERLAESLQKARLRLTRLGPWARQHRLGLSLAAALVLAGFTLGNLLVQLHPVRIAVAPAEGRPPADPQVATETGQIPASPAASSASGTGTVVFRIEPWGKC